MLPSHVSLASQRVRQGSAILFGMILVIVLAGAATVLTDVTISRFADQGRRQDQVALLMTAESAFNEAFDYFQQDPTRFPTAGTVPYDQSHTEIFEASDWHNKMTVKVEVEFGKDEDTSKWGDESYIITATATAGNMDDRADYYRRRVVKATIKPEEIALWNQAMYAIDGFNFMGAAMTDSYDSSAGPYATPPDQDWLNSSGDIASGGSAVDLNGNVHGTVTSGVEMYMPVFNYDPPSGTVTIESPAGSGGINAGYTFTGPGTYHTGSIDLDSGDVIRVEGGGLVKLYVDGAIKLNRGELQFDGTGSQIQVFQSDYVGDDSEIHLNGNTGIGTIVPVSGAESTGTSEPKQFLWVSNYSGTMSLEGTASLSGAILAPRTTFNMRGTFDLFGSVIAKSFGDTDSGENGKVNGSFNFHYDESLKGISPDIIPRLQVAGWTSYYEGWTAGLEDAAGE